MPVMRVVVGSLAVLLALGLVACKAPAPARADNAPMNPATEKAAIRLVLHDFLERTPGAQPVDVEVAQVGVDSGYALVTWTHDKEAGQAVLRKQSGAWTVIESGVGWLGLRGVSAEQVPADVAKRLLDQIDPKWGSYEVP